MVPQPIVGGAQVGMGLSIGVNQQSWCKELEFSQQKWINMEM
jgi:hypothetical protein